MTARERKLMMGCEVGFGLRVGVRWIGRVAEDFCGFFWSVDNCR